MSFTLEQQVQNNTDRLDALKKIDELVELLSINGTEKMVVSVPDGSGGFDEKKIDPNLFFKGNFLRKTTNYELLDSDKGNFILFEANGVSLNLPLDLGWSNGDKVFVVSYGVNFTITKHASVVLKKPAEFQNILNSYYIITKTDSNEFSVVQIPLYNNLTGKTLRGGMTHISGLQYFVWANRYTINDITYEDYISDVITLTDGDSVDPRYDVIAIELIDIRDAPAEFVIIEGTPAPGPIKPLVDYTTQTEFTFQLVNANDTSDPYVTTETVYNENAEWTNTFLLTGGDLDSTIDPAVGSKHIEVVDGTMPVDARIVWDKGSLVDFDINGRLIFRLQTHNVWSFDSDIRIKLTNSGNGAYFDFQLNRNNVINYGFYDTLSTWQYVIIELSDFNSSSRSNTQFDLFEFTFGNFSFMYIDKVEFQSNLPSTTTTPTTETKPTNVNTEGLTVIPLTNHECYIGSASSPSTASSFALSVNKVLGGRSYVYVNTTGKSDFPPITGTRLMDGSYFEEGEIFEGEIFWDGTNANLTWKKVGTSLNPQDTEGSSFTLATTNNSQTIFVGDDITLNPNTQTYQNNFEVFCVSESATDTDIICTAATGWTYSLKGATPVSSGTFTFTAKGTCAIIRKESNNLIYIYGDVS